MINKAIIIGNLGADPELRTTSGGQSVCELRVATNERFKAKDGEWQERTEWHRIILWGRDAENASKFLAKGRRVYVEGRIQTREWTTQQGEKRYTTEIVAQAIKFLDSREGGGGGGGRWQGPPPPEDGDAPAESNDGSFSDDEIPF